MKIIGLTGGIGAGKSTVSAILKEAGCRIIDADKISRRITEKKSVLSVIAETFGADMLDEDGNLNRKKLAHVVFSEKKQLDRLEDIITKEVVRIIEKKLKQLRAEGCSDLVIIDAPLLFESGADRLTDAVWCVETDLETRIRRVMARDGVSREDVERRIASQMDDDERALRSQEIINNAEGEEALGDQLKRLIEQYAETK